VFHFSLILTFVLFVPLALFARAIPRLHRD
jgi:hypothetical protein